jgi:hypothetical protein
VCQTNLLTQPDLITVPTLSEPFFLCNSTRLTILTSNGVEGVIIPDKSDEFIFINLFMGEFNIQSVHLGYKFALFIHLWPKFTVLQFSWPDVCLSFHSISQRCLETEELDLDFFGTSIALFVDISSGRILISGNTHNQLVLDTVII